MNRRVQKFHTQSDMPSVGPKLKALRSRAQPTLTIRKMAEELGIGYSRYAYFEDEKRYKKATLPLDMTRAIADVLARYGVDPAEVMALAGLTDAEVEPEARDIEAHRPTLVSINLPVVLPSEAALRDMFRSLLVLVPEGATKDEAAAILARRLPSGLAAIGPLSLDQASVASLVSGEVARSPATDRPASRPSSRT
ncbi:helix-turn-helix domain-containing protein [Sphingobium sp. RSMS]|uniref:helix-turn-helix transcriptional regulator n=1 Tax=Sphingobium sp. RSMS TaxID=520734 RepID=UPI00148584FB|nr:helix-turn-helix transcriptional regulator [Sphingobium sp. RSMS]UXC90112.1 helix-turn-helix domain-containing protein [Sphingobium sp. RSMS]